jgi:hypothetical protein
MRNKIISRILLAFLLITSLMLALSAQSVKATERTNVKMYVWNPETSSTHYPGKPYPQTTWIQIWIDAPDAWTDTAAGIVSYNLKLRFDPEFAEATAASQFPDLDDDGFPNGFLGVYLSNYHPEWTLGVLWAPPLVDNVAGTVEIAEAIAGYTFLGLGAGGSLTDPVTGDPLDPTPLARIAIRTRSDATDVLTTWLQIIDAVYLTPDSVRHPVEVVGWGTYGLPLPTPEFPFGLAPIVVLAPLITIIYLRRTRKKTT